MTNTLDWQDGQPFSAHYGDIYFSRESGIAETRHVFLDQNHLAERWRALPEGHVFVIAETGFGTGLNFLCAWDLWRRVAPPGARLHFVSCELHPLRRTELEQALRLWPELDAYAAQLTAQYDEMAPGWHRYAFERGSVVLTLLIGDVLTTLPQLDAGVDAWFLDGFAPARNPGMWRPELYALMARISAEHATFATFTSAGDVRRGLQAAGFRTEKVPGHGRKREMLRGRLAADDIRNNPVKPGSAVVIGAGMAGCATAHALATRGWQVALIDRHAEIAGEASGNHQGILYARLMPKPSPLSELTLAGYQHTLRRLHHLMPQGEATWQACGLLQLGFDARESARLQGIANLALPTGLLHAVSREQASALAGVALPFDGLYFPGGGWVSPPALCHALTDHPAITRLLGFEVSEITHADGYWHVMKGDATLASAEAVVVACANHSKLFSQTAHLPLRSIRGQVTHLPATPQSNAVQAVLCTEGYVAPARQGVHTLGATYGNLEETTELREADHLENLGMLQQLSATLYAAVGGETLEARHLDGRASCRCNVVDYLPLVGQVAPDHPGLFVNTGHGSRGLITALLSAELLASDMTGEPVPLPRRLKEAVSPGRFLPRQAL